MKKAIYILFLLPVIASAQTVVVTKDTTWQESANGSFYENRLVEWSNGESSLNRRLVGDTSTVFNSYLQAFVSEAGRMANVVFEARDFDNIIRGMMQRRDSVLAQINRDLTDTLAGRYATPLLQSGWNVTEDTTLLNVTFSISAAGQLRYEITGQPTRNAFLFGRAMRLNNYKDTGKSLDVYNAPGGNWFSIDDRVRIKLPGNQGLNRSALSAPKSTKSGVLVEYFTDEKGKTSFFAGDAVTLKKSGTKHIITLDGRTFELVEKKK